jgi:class 3 adenylate cyclase
MSQVMALLLSGGRHQRRPGYRGRPEVTGRPSKRCNARPDHTFGSKAIGDRRWRELLDTHDQLAHQLVQRHRGSLVKTTGDGVLATFDGPGRAVHCALAFRLATQQIGLPMRAGLHTGEVEIRGKDIGGIAVHVAARVMTKSDANEVLVSRVVTDLVAGTGL